MKNLNNYLEAKKLIESSYHITIAGHINPDADAIGTALGLWWVFKEFPVKKVDVLFVSKPLPFTLSFLPGFSKIRSKISEKSDLLIAVDSGDFGRVGIERPKNIKIINIDHHISNTLFGDINLIEKEFASASEVAFKLVDISGWPMKKEAATNFYAALLSDTGFFSYEGVNERVFEFAKSLLLLGADAEWIARMLRENQPLSKVRLLSKALGSLKLYLNGLAAGVDVTQKMMNECGATISDSEDIVNFARSLATVEVGFMVRDEADGALKVSLRSKSKVDVCKIALEFGGGGHKRASGFSVCGITRSELIERIIKKIEEELVVEKR